MASQPDPVVQHRRLRTELRALRRKDDKTQEQVAKAMDWSTSKLLRIETGEVRAAPSDVRVLALYYEASEKQVEQLVEMARNARGDSWPAYKDVHQQASLNYFAYEAAASLMRFYQSSLIPGLLQTEEYAVGTLTDTFGYDEEERERRWEARAKRQERLERDDPPSIFCLLDEGVVRRQVASPGVTRRQLEHLIELGERNNISVRVIPFSAGAHPGMTGPFTLLEFPDAQDDDVLYLEHVDGDKVIRDEAAVTVTYTERFFALEKIALSEAKTSELLEEIIAGLSGTKTTKAAAPKAEAAAAT
jgi:transcriptional regulator with XRE-family HTH domain